MSEYEDIYRRTMSDPFIRRFAEEHPEMMLICECKHAKIFHQLQSKFFRKIIGRGCKICKCNNFQHLI